MIKRWGQAIQRERRRGRRYQPRFRRRQIAVTSCGALLALALAVSLTIVLGQQLRCLHPPAGGMAFLVVYVGADWGFCSFQC